jgi:hypothetical protein
MEEAAIELLLTQGVEDRSSIGNGLAIDDPCFLIEAFLFYIG